VVGTALDEWEASLVAKHLVGHGDDILGVLLDVLGSNVGHIAQTTVSLGQSRLLSGQMFQSDIIMWSQGTAWQVVASHPLISCFPFSSAILSLL